MTPQDLVSTKGDSDDGSDGSQRRLTTRIIVVFSSLQAKIILRRTRRGRRDLSRISSEEPQAHDMRVWCIASEQFALKAHPVIKMEADHDRALATYRACSSARSTSAT